MPFYLYKNPESGEIAEVFQGMNDIHTYESEGVVWKRIFTRPQVGADTQINPNSVHQFVENTGKKKGTYGDLLEASAEMSHKRAEQHGGVDPVKSSYFEKYKKETGKTHFYDKPKVIENKQAIIEF